MPNVNRIFALRSGTLNASIAAWINRGHRPPPCTSDWIMPEPPRALVTD